MRMALSEARRAAKADEVPVGAVILLAGKLIARGRNRIRELKDPTAHAEILAIRQAGSRLKKERLLDTILYTTVEPCAMCAGAIVLARVRRVVYAAAEPKTGAGGSLVNLLNHPGLNYRAEMTGGLLAGTSRRLLQGFFQAKRRSA